MALSSYLNLVSLTRFSRTYVSTVTMWRSKIPINILRNFPESEPFDNHFNYRSVIGKLGYFD